MGWWGPYCHSPKSEPTGRQSEKLGQSQHILGCDSLACVTKCHPAQLQVPGCFRTERQVGISRDTCAAAGRTASQMSMVTRPSILPFVISFCHSPQFSLCISQREQQRGQQALCTWGCV